MPRYESTHLMANHVKLIEELVLALSDALETNKRHNEEISRLKIIIENLNNIIATSDIKFGGN